MCQRLLTHNCFYRENNKILIIAHDYNSCSLNNLNSSINDVTIVWNYLRRKRCFNENQIFIYGDLNIDGKMIPWRKRYFKGIPLKDILKGCNYFYYTGHGHSNGEFNNYNLEGNKDIFYIIDSCYSYLWNHPMKGIMSSTDGIETFISISTQKCSYFTGKLFEYLEISDLSDIKEWFQKHNFKLEGDYSHLK